VAASATAILNDINLSSLSSPPKAIQSDKKSFNPILNPGQAAASPSNDLAQPFLTGLVNDPKRPDPKASGSRPWVRQK
jgi:hypothetical protein